MVLAVVIMKKKGPSFQNKSVRKGASSDINANIGLTLASELQLGNGNAITPELTAQVEQRLAGKHC